MKISVVTAVYNRAATLSDTIASLRAQSYADIEHIVQDGGSTDGTLELLAERAHPQMKVVSEPDHGLYDAINRGIARATGDVIGLLHSDDVLAHPDVLKRVADRFTSLDVDGVYGDLVYVSAGDLDRVVRYWRSGSYRPEQLRKGWMPPHPTLYLRRRVLDVWQGYDTDFRIAADYEAMLRWLVKGRIRLDYIPEVLVRMRMGGESNRSLGRIILKSREDYRAICRHGIGGIGTLAAKNFSKLGQFIHRNEGIL